MKNSKKKNLKSKKKLVKNQAPIGSGTQTDTKQDTIIKVLKKIFNLKVLAAIAGVVAAAAAVWAVWPEGKVDKLRNEINKNTTIIEESFQPNRIKIDSLSTPDFQLIKDFQISTLQLASYWRSINTMQSPLEYEFFDSETIMKISLSQLSTMDKFNREVLNVLAYIESIQAYGKSNNIEYYYTQTDKTILLKEKTIKSKNAGMDEFNVVIKNIYNLIDKYGGGSNVNSVPKEEIIKGIKPYEKLYCSEEALDFYNEFFTYCIEVNSMYMCYLMSISKID